jgi:hypothetical protein
MVLDNLILIGGALLVMGLLLGTMTQIWKVLIAYRITDHDIQVLLFHFIPIYHIPFHKIVKMHEASFYEVALVPGFHLFTQPFAQRVVIKQRGRWFPLAFLTPNNPSAFIADVKRHLRD